MFSAYFEFLGPKVWTSIALLLIISWSADLEYAIFLGQSVRSIWDPRAKNGGQMAELKLK